MERCSPPIILREFATPPPQLIHTPSRTRHVVGCNIKRTMILQPSPPPSHGRGQCQWQRGGFERNVVLIIHLPVGVLSSGMPTPVVCHAMTGVSPWGVAKSWFEKSTTPCEKQQLCVPGKVI